MKNLSYQSKPQVLFRGSIYKLKIISPSQILEQEKHRFPQGLKEVIFASPYIQDAIAHGLASEGSRGFNLSPFWKNEEKKEIGWSLTLECHKSDLSLEDEIYLYELDPKAFTQNSEGEYYSVSKLKPLKITELSTDQALQYFDEVKFSLDLETQIKGEGNQGFI